MGCEGGHHLGHPHNISIKISHASGSVTVIGAQGVSGRGPLNTQGFCREYPWVSFSYLRKGRKKVEGQPLVAAYPFWSACQGYWCRNQSVAWSHI
eukprot:1158753-Pelagomonas_calceolata.AAC.2